MPTPTTASEATCLLVDDHAGLRHGMRLLLESDDALSVVGEAPSGERALVLLRNLRPDVALIDACLLTSLDGFQITRHAREEQLPTRVVIYTAYRSGEHVRRAFDCGAFGYVHKLSSYGTVLASLHAAANGDRYVDPATATDLVLRTEPMLSHRECEVLELLARGMQNDGIAHDLRLSSETIKTHVSRIFSKLGTHTRAGAVAQGFRSGLLA